MNPPWQSLKPEDDDFFSQDNPKFRKLNKKEKKTEKDKLLLNSTISKIFQKYTELTQKRVNFCKLSGQYTKRGTGDTDLWKLFLERSLYLLSENGTLSIVVPSGLATNKGAKELREELFGMNIRCIFEFENTKGIFLDVHRSYKFILFVADCSKPSDNFSARSTYMI